MEEKNLCEADVVNYKKKKKSKLGFDFCLELMLKNDRISKLFRKIIHLSAVLRHAAMPILPTCQREHFRVRSVISSTVLFRILSDIKHISTEDFAPFSVLVFSSPPLN